MKRIFAALAACGLGGFSLATATAPAGVPEAAPAADGAGRLVVHEWGTFTGLAGSDGVHLPFGVQVGEDLPPFVVNRVQQAERLGVKIPVEFFLTKGGGLSALQRMETPVVYFYADRPRDVSAKVDFPKGLLTEFYPPVRAMAPALGEGPGEPRPVAATPALGTPAAGTQLVLGGDAKPAQRGEGKLEGGSLDWGTVHLVPQRPGGSADGLPPVPVSASSPGHYRFARETDAALVRFSDRPGEAHEERFLFYRGLGNFALPVTLSATDGDRFEMTSAGEQPVKFAMLLKVEGGKARFSAYADVRGRRAMALPAEAVPLDRVGDAIAAALVAEGLYEKEARAMVKTWSAHWLGEPGTRVLYTVPRAVTDGLLPLRVSPTPDETVRVLVGRIDVLTPPEEARLQAMLAAAPGTKALAAADVAYLQGLGRFREAAFDRAAQLRRGAGTPAQGGALDVQSLRSLYYDALRAAQAARAN